MATDSRGNRANQASFKHHRKLHYVADSPLKNQIHALLLNPKYSQKVLASLEQMLVPVQGQITDLEAESKKLIQEHYQDMSDNLTSIPGIGSKTALALT